MTVQIARRLFTVLDYYRMAEAGILGEDDRVELIEGEIVEMPPIGSHHASTVFRLNSILTRMLMPEQAIVGIQSPVRLNEQSEPQPDVCLLKPRADFYANGHPGPGDILLLIEVADSSVDYDLQVKVPLYAATGIAEVWIVNLVAASIEIYRRPAEAGYEERRRVGRGDALTPQAFPDVVLAVDEVLG
jgi:Uma2 family endonuclease